MRKGSYFRANERMYLRTIGRRFTQMIAYFLIMNSKRCIINYHVSCRINRLLIFLSNLQAGETNTAAKRLRMRQVEHFRSIFQSQFPVRS